MARLALFLSGLILIGTCGCKKDDVKEPVLKDAKGQLQPRPEPPPPGTAPPKGGGAGNTPVAD
jgi:hypothetical protein